MKIRLAVLASFLAQAAPPGPTLEVATIKRNTSASEAARVSAQASRVTITNNPLRNIIRNAWGLQGFQIVGGPEWINTDWWDIVAKAAGNPRDVDA